MVIPLCRILIFGVVMISLKELSDLGIFGGKAQYKATIRRSNDVMEFVVDVMDDHLTITHLGPLAQTKGPFTVLNENGLGKLSKLHGYSVELIEEVLEQVWAELVAMTDEEVAANLLRALNKEKLHNNLTAALKSVRFLDLCHGQVKLGPVIDGVQYYLPSNLALVNLETNPALEAYNNLLYKALPRDPHEPEA